jgi:DNA-binding PadR family transcriptional regulator
MMHFNYKIDIVEQKDNLLPQTKKKVNITHESISLLENQLLAALSKQERYGIEIVKVFEKASAGEKTIGLSTLYTVLARLEKYGLVESRMEGERTNKKGGAQRKYFRITKKGCLELAKQEIFQQRVAECQLQPT